MAKSPDFSQHHRIAKNIQNISSSLDQERVIGISRTCILMIFRIFYPENPENPEKFQTKILVMKMFLQGPHTLVVRLWGVWIRYGIWWLHSQTYFRIFFGRSFLPKIIQKITGFSFKSQAVGGTQSNHHCLEITTRTCSKSNRRPESNMELSLKNKLLFFVESFFTWKLRI